MYLNTPSTPRFTTRAPISAARRTCGLSAAHHDLARDPVGARRDQHHGQVAPVPVGVEHARGQGERGQPPGGGRDEPVHQQRHRQEGEQEDVAVEQHGLACPSDLARRAARVRAALAAGSASTRASSCGSCWASCARRRRRPWASRRSCSAGSCPRARSGSDAAGRAGRPAGPGGARSSRGAAAWRSRLRLHGREHDHRGRAPGVHGGQAAFEELARRGASRGKSPR